MMARPRVRHCKECLYYSKSRSGRFHVCKKVPNSYDPNVQGRFIDGQEIRNSPRWCPLGRNLRRSIVG